MTAGTDSILTFSLPVSGKNGSHDDVFNPDRAGLKSPTEEGGSKGEAAAGEGREGLDESSYEDCAPETVRYVPPERYVDVRHTDNLEGQPVKNFESTRQKF